MPAGNSFKVPETAKEWQDASVWSTKPPQISSGTLYLLRGTITASPGVIQAQRTSRQYALGITYPDAASSSATLTLKCLSPAANRLRERNLDEIVGELVVDKPVQGLVGVYNSQHRKISAGSLQIGYLLMPGVVEAVINNSSVLQLADLRIR